MPGFTLIELLLVIALIFVLGVFLFPAGVVLVSGQTLSETTSDIASTLRRAQSEAVLGKHANSFGVKIIAPNYVLFEGDSYAARIQSEDEEFTFSSRILTEGLDEVVFEKRTGEANATGSISLSLDGEQKEIFVYEKGTVE